jgi:hypothetical protein
MTSDITNSQDINRAVTENKATVWQWNGNMSFEERDLLRLVSSIFKIKINFATYRFLENVFFYHIHL